MILYPAEPCPFTKSFQRLNGERGIERIIRANKSTWVGDDGSTSYVATHTDYLLALHVRLTQALLGIFDRDRSRGVKAQGKALRGKGRASSR